MQKLHLVLENRFMAYFARDLSHRTTAGNREPAGVAAYPKKRPLPSAPLNRPRFRRNAEPKSPGLEAHFAALDAGREATSSDDADAIFEEAMRQTRPNYRTHR